MHGVQLIVPPLVAVLLTIVAAWITTGTGPRRSLGVAIGIAAMLPVWWLPSEYPLARGICALVAFLGTMRVVDLSRGDWPLPRRLRHVLSAVDSRRLIRRPPRLDWTALGQALAWSGIAAAGVWGLQMSLRQHGPIAWLTRWGSGLVVVYSAVAALYLFVPVAYGAIGFDTPPLHVAPFRSRSVQELWGERWARPISDWLGDNFFKPYARKRRPLTGILLAFAVSAAFHAYAVWVALGLVDGLVMAATMFAYFILQGAIMKLERVVRVRRWRPWPGHAWTVAWMVMLAPIFIEPVVTAMGFPAPSAHTR